VRNATTQHFDEHPEELDPFPQQIVNAVEGGWMHLGADESTPGVDPDRECYPAGQGVGAIHELIPAGDLVRQFVDEAEAVLARLGVPTSG
jgi:enoyl-[acyl-carrier protein] reductase II